MSEPFLSANPLLSQSDSNSHRANMFQALMGSSEAVPLDGSGVFSLLRTTRYRQLVATLTEGQFIKQKMQQQYHLLNLANIELQKQTSLYKERLNLYQQNEQKLEQQINSLSQRLKQSNQRLLEVEDQLKRLSLSACKLQPKVFTFQELSRKTDTKQSGAQTCWEDQQLSSLQKEPEIVMQLQQEDTSKMEQRLYQLLRSNAETFENEFRERLKKLEECQMTIDNWEKEKEELREENQRLKQQAHLRSLEDEKIKVWQQTVGDFMQNIQKSILESKPDVQPSNQNNASREDWETQALQRGKLAELRLRIREAEEQMQVDEKGDEDGPVVTLVRLSQQVKSIVRGMLIQSEYS